MKNLRNIIVLAVLAFFLGGFTIETKAQNNVVTEVPAGYGRYCSVTYPNGSSGLIIYSDKNSDPCEELTKPGSSGKIQRAGLWSVNGENNVLRTCEGDVGIYRQAGDAIIKTAYADGKNKKHCIYTIAPTTLPVFSKPYKISNEGQVQLSNAHNFNRYEKPLKPSDFGQTVNSNCPNTTQFNRLGKQFCFNHSGYDWVMPTGTEMLAVAKGVVRVARWRDTSMFGGDCDKKSPQGEIYVEHQIGKDEYAERFIVYYAHLSKINVKDGDRVTPGQVIGKSGDSGCSTAPHLHFGVMRTTNLSGYRKLDPTYPKTGYGISILHGEIDPFGWNAPKGIDPWAWQNFGSYEDRYIGTVVNPGAFSINLWREGQAPPHNK